MKNTNIKALGISTILTIVLITFMTIYGELNSAFKDFLKNLLGHHWISKGVIALAFFIIIYFALKNLVSKKEDVRGYINWVIISSVLGSLIILLFYVYEFFA